MAAVAVSANRLFEIREEMLMLVGVDFVFGVTAHAELVDFRRRIHNIWRCAVAAGSPGFVGNVLVGLAVTNRAADIGPGVDNSNIFLHIIYVTNEAAAVVGLRPIRLTGARLVVQQQQRFIIEQ